MSESNAIPPLDLGPVARATIAGALLFGGAAVVWQIPAAREILNRTTMRKIALDLVTSLLRADGLAAPGLA